MTIELTKEARTEAIASIERYFREHMDEPIGNVAAGGLLGFFLEEIGPSIYNKAVLRRVVQRCSPTFSSAPAISTAPWRSTGR